MKQLEEMALTELYEIKYFLKKNTSEGHFRNIKKEISLAEYRG